MVASVLSANPPLQRQKSPDMQDTSSSSNGSKPSRGPSGFGALLRRASQRGGFTSEPQQPVDSNSSSAEQRKGLGRILGKTKSLRGLEDSVSSSKSDSRQRRRRSLDISDHSDGPSGVSSFLSQIEPSQEQEQAPVQCLVEKPLVEKPKVERKASGGLRGLLFRAASLRGGLTSKKSSKEEPDLEPLLVLTDENRGKVVFQTSEDLHIDANLHASLPDLFGLSISSSGRSTACSSSTDSPVAATKPLHSSFQTAERGSANSPEHVFYLDLEQQPEDPHSAPEQQPSPKGFRGRLRTFFKRTKSGRTVTEEAVGEGPHVYVPPQPATVPIRDIALPSLMVDKTENQRQKIDPPQDNDESSEGHSRHIMAGLMDVVQEYEDYANDDTGSHSSDEEDDYFEGDDESNFSQSEEDFGEPPEEADAAEALDDFMSSYCPEPYMDIQVEPQPARVYDELEIFYEEMTFEHVGGSMLLGAASELLTVQECDAEDYTEDGEEAQEEL
jgi:hypothetical protein